MKESKALDLVNSYSHHTKQIKRLTNEISENLSLCQKLSGDSTTHISSWYTPEIVDNGYLHDPDIVYYEITADEHGVECQHCYATHLAIQARKDHKRKIANVKGCMTRGGESLE